MSSETPGSTVSLAEQGSFLSKPSLHMVGCTGKTKHSFTTTPDGFCPLCKAKGQMQALKTYRINFTQSIFLCSNPQCIYPLGYTPLDNIIVPTADLKNPSTSNQKKRNISELSPPALPDKKRTKFDPDISAQYSHTNAGPSTPEDRSNSIPIISKPEYELGQTENKDFSKENVLETELFSVLCNKSDCPVVSSGSCSTSGQDRLNKEIPQNVQIMDHLSIGSDHCKENSNELSEMNGLAESKGKEHEKSESYPVLENPESSPEFKNRRTVNGALRNLELHLDTIHSSQLTDLATMNDRSPKVTPILLESKEHALTVSKSTEMQPEEPCNFNENCRQSLGESSESEHCAAALQNLEPAQPMFAANPHQVLCSPDFKEDGLPVSFESATSVLMKDKCEQDLNKSLTFVSPWLVGSVGALGSLLPKSPNCSQDASEMESMSCLLNDTPSLCRSNNNSLMDVSQSPCCIKQVDKGCSTAELPAPTLKVCNLSPTVQLEDAEKTSLFSSVDNKPELVSKDDSSVSVLGKSCTAEAAVNQGPEGPEESPMQDDNLSNMDNVSKCSQQSSSETTTLHALTQDILPDNFSSDRLSGNVANDTEEQLIKCKDGQSVDSTATLVGDMELPDQLDLVNGCQKSVDEGIMSSDPLHVTKTVDNSSLMEVCNFPSKSDSTTTEPDIEPCNGLLEIQKCILNSVNHCGLSTPSQTILDVPSSPCQITSIADNDSNASIPSPLSESHMDICESTPTPQVKDVLAKEGTILNKKASPVKDTESSKPPASPLSESDLESKKAYFENTVLPDLLLDIQLEHLAEESLTAATCKEELKVAVSRDHTNLDPLNVLQDRLVEQHLQGEENGKMEITDPELSNDELQNGINSSGILPSDNSLNNDSFESGPLDTSVEQRLLNKIVEPKTFQNSQRRLQWRNKLSLCWLDCILSALVQSKTIDIFVADCDNSRESLIRNLFAKYNEAMAMGCKLNSKRGRTGKPAKFEVCLHEVRIHIFDKLKPLLKCELGQKESPVFAFPLLLKLDPDFQDLFMHSFTWNFKCKSCGYTYQERCQKTLTTFTKIAKDWQPLNAVHRSPCNKCQAEDQARQMNLETLQSMFMLHFVEGLPSNNLKEYAFHFDGHWYEIRTVIKYRDDHFSTWTENDDDTWLESDGLKGSICWRHQKFKVRAENIHIVIWERSNSKAERENVQIEGKSEDQSTMPTVEISSIEAAVESLFVAPLAEANTSASCVEHPPQVTPTVVVDQLASVTENAPQISPATETRPSAPTLVAPVSSSVAPDTSNPLTGMEGYAEDDIITLTLIEIPFDSKNCTVENKPDLKPLDPGVTQVNADSGVALQSNVHILQQPQHRNTSDVMHSLSCPTSSNAVPVADSLQMPQNTDPSRDALSKSVLASSKGVSSVRGSRKPQPIERNQMVCLSDPQSSDTIPVLNPIQLRGPDLGQGVLSQSVPQSPKASSAAYSSQLPKRSASSPVVHPSSVLASSDTLPVKDRGIRQISTSSPSQTKTDGNLLPAVVATSTPIHQSFTTKRSVVSDLMSSLVKKDNSFLNGSISSVSRKNVSSKQWQPFHLLKETDVNGATKKAKNFDGFRTGTLNKNSVGSNLLLSKLANNSSVFNAPKEKTIPLTQTSKPFNDRPTFNAPKERPTVKSLLTSRPGKNGSLYGKMSQDGSTNEDKVKKLRLKLMKKLKAKKNELAMLEKMAKLKQNGSFTGKNPGVLQGGINRQEHLRDFLQELQEQIDNADNESVCTMSSCTSVCSSPGDAEFFAELFSPSPVDNPGNDSRFLEMLADGFQISDYSQQASGFDPQMKSSTVQSTSGVNSCPTNLSQSSSGEESFNIMSSSTLAALNEDTDYLTSFDDMF